MVDILSKKNLLINEKCKGENVEGKQSETEGSGQRKKEAKRGKRSCE